ncbi:Uncharacterized protein dnl_35420 [Desulfonema limicola]|uniref:Uncharacterized protein n=1 Tax=Desulfonema limicola TaxID=45656 RepID=A0A975B953_9BACT|nr:hypothetical protein [Desulfonema limicola]QTA81211.1 Uncharacterized protein dnl_35420 [Desulfonema limicola]
MFNETLKINLELTIKNDKFRIPGGNIKNIEVNLFPYGFDAAADFWVSSEKSEDKLFPKFTGSDLIEARLSVAGVYNQPKPSPKPLVVKGVVTSKSFTEENYEDVPLNPVWFRRYSIHFKDPAQVLWKQHYPLALYVDAKMEDVIKAQVVQGISLNMTWKVLTEAYPLICLSMGNGCEVSFYDFLIWYVRSQNGVFTFETKTQSYLLSDQKSSEGDQVFIKPDEVKSLLNHMPEICRYNTKILNSHAELPKAEETEQDYSVSNIRKHVLLCTSIAKDFDKQKTLETAKLKNNSGRVYEINLVFSQFPAKTFTTGTFVKLDMAQWSKQIFPYSKDYRVLEIHLKARSERQNPTEDKNMAYAKYQTKMSARLESKENPYIHLPGFKSPEYPVRAEGKIVSESGEATDKTYQIYTDKDTSQDCYTINVPLWNKDIRILFEPVVFPGHFYFPGFKNSRVLVALWFNNAEILRFLDWGAGSRLPMDSQGNHILFGKNAVSQTSMKYDYQDEKPVFNIKRASAPSTTVLDTELIQMEEGSIIIQTCEEEAKAGMEETFNVSPEVEAARVQLAMENEAGMAGVTADFEAAKSGITGAITGAVAEAQAALEIMDEEISAKSKEINSRVSAAMSQLSKSTSQLEVKAKQTRAELMALAEL